MKKETEQSIANLWGDKYNMLPSDRIKLAKDIKMFAQEKMVRTFAPASKQAARKGAVTGC